MFGDEKALDAELISWADEIIFTLKSSERNLLATERMQLFRTARILLEKVERPDMEVRKKLIWLSREYQRERRSRFYIVARTSS